MKIITRYTVKKAFLSFLILFVLKSSYGQTRFGVKAGLNLATVNGFDPKNNDMRIGLHAGGLVQVGLSDKFALQPELLYSVKGQRSPATTFSGGGTLSLNYISIPFLVNYRAVDNLSILLGPEMGFLVSAHSRFDGNKTDVSKNFNELDFGVNLGLAYTVAKSLGIDVRYNYGFKGLANVSFTDEYGRILRHGKIGANRGVQLGVFYMIPKK